MKRFLAVAFCAMISLALFASMCQADDITYDVDQTIGEGSVTGFIETDGTIGTIGETNILDWNLVLNDNNPTYDLLGPLQAGTNSTVTIVQNDLTATATQLEFNLAATDGGYVGFTGGTPDTGSEFWILFANNDDASLAGIGGIYFLDNGAGEIVPGIVEQLNTEEVIGTVPAAAPVPEPSTYGLTLIGLGMLGLKCRS